jgi:hypothetical protein
MGKQKCLLSYEEFKTENNFNENIVQIFTCKIKWKLAAR